MADTKAAADLEAPHPTGGSVRRPWKALAVLLLLTLLVRMCVILAPPPDLDNPVTGRVDEEELLRGNGARDLIEGLLLPLQDYRVNDFWGGSLALSILSVPFFLLLGPNIAALRMSTLLFACLCTACVFLILDRHASRRAAWNGGLFLCFTPPGYTFYFSMAYGAHFESTALAMLILWLFLGCFWTPGARGLRFVFLGLAAGFALSWGYGILLLIALLLGFLFLLDKLFFLRKNFWIAASGFAAGLFPWIHYILVHASGRITMYNVDFFQYILGRQARTGPGAKILSFFQRDLADSFWFRDTLPLDGRLLGHLAAWTLAGLCLFAAWHWRASLRRALGALARRRTEPAELHPLWIPLAFPLLFLPVYFFSNFRIIRADREWVLYYRYLMILYPFLALPAAAALDVLWRRSRAGPWLSRAAVFFLCGLFLAGTLLRCEPSRLEANWKDRGYDAGLTGRFVALKYENDRPALERFVDRLGALRPESEQDEILFVLGQQYKQLARPDDRRPPGAGMNHEAYARTLLFLQERVGERYKPYFERPVPGERFFNYGQRERFWRDYQRRKGEAQQE